MRIFLLTTATVITLGLGTVAALACGELEAQMGGPSFDPTLALMNNNIGPQMQDTNDALNSDFVANSALMARTAPVDTAYSALSEVTYKGSGDYTLDVGQAFGRLELQAELEDFYAGVVAQAEGLSEEEKIALYHAVAPQLDAIIDARADKHSFAVGTLGARTLSDAQYDLAIRLGLSAIPA